jgi:hypothetical protein
LAKLVAFLNILNLCISEMLWSGSFGFYKNLHLQVIGNFSSHRFCNFWTLDGWIAAQQTRHG